MVIPFPLVAPRGARRATRPAVAAVVAPPIVPSVSPTLVTKLQRLATVYPLALHTTESMADYRGHEIRGGKGGA